MKAPQTILYLGADARVRNVLQLGVRDAGVDADSDTSGAHLQDLLARSPASVLVIDAMRDSGRDNLELAQAVNRDRPGISVILFGGAGLNLRGALRAGVRDVIDGRDSRAFAELVASVRRELIRRETSLESADPSSTLASVFETWPAPVMITDNDARIRQANRAAERILGRARGGLVGKEFNSLCIPGGTPEPESRLSRIMRRAIDGAGMRMRTGTGEAVNVLWIASRLPDDSGSLVVGRDLSSQIAAETEIAASEVRFRRLIRASLEGILILRVTDGIILGVNPVLERQLGLKKVDWSGQPVWRLKVFAETIPDASTLGALAKRTLLRREEIELKVDGGFRQYEFSVHLSSEGGEQMLVCNFRDLSELKLREQQARKRADQLEVLSELAIHASQSLDIDGSCTEIVARLSASLSSELAMIVVDDREETRYRIAAMQCEAATDAAAGHFIDRGASIAFSPINGSRPRIDRLIGGGAFDQQLRQRGFCELLSAPLAVEGRPVGMLLLGRIGARIYNDEELAFAGRVALQIAGAVRSARLYAELQGAYKELQVTQERAIAQERLRALGTMASGIAHDFNNALSPVMGFSELLIDNPDILTDRARALHYLELIRTGAIDGSNVVSRLREFYRHRESPEELQSVNLNAVVTGVIEITQPRWKGIAQATGTQIAVRPELGPVRQIFGRESELREMLTNLVLNAIDAMPDGGELCIHTDQLPSGRVVVEVSDTGCGMTQEVRRHCLEPFYSTKGERGTGLGLAMVYGTVQRHGGGIDISSVPGHGTTVSIYLPENADAKVVADAPLMEAAQEKFESLRVLVAEDDPAIRELLCDQLTADGHEVTLASDGMEALERYRPGVHDVVITDGAMPRMSGSELARRLKTRPHPPRVVLLSGFGETMNFKDEQTNSIDLVLRKPLSRHRLRSSLGFRLRSSERGTDNDDDPRSDQP